MRYQPIYDIAALCAHHDVTRAVLCPGSRCAPLTLAFARHPGITCKTFSDERSAGFVALGMAQASGSPVVVVCTSGTAVLNLAPAVSEAYFSETPVVVITADRPEEWIAQHDGQTIYQREVFGKHVKGSFQLPQDYDHPESQWAINRMVNEALNLSRQLPSGPVHINAPFREPLYPKPEESIGYAADLRVIHDHLPLHGLTDAAKSHIKAAWPGMGTVLLVAGQHHTDPELVDAVREFQHKLHVPVVHDIISNLHEVENSISHQDLFLGQASDKQKTALRPDLLITFGQSLVSKNLKVFLRKYPAKRHWHIQPAGAVADTFKNLTDIFHTSAPAFLRFIASTEVASPAQRQEQQKYFSLWQQQETRVLRALDEFFHEQRPAGELAAVKHLLDSVPDDSDLHLANSMSVRYANFIGLQGARKGVRVFSNRGTSGIDGSTSTAVGHSLTSGRPNLLITGDVAFFYDRNAFWHNYPLSNLRILLLNNHGGLIFDVLEGPASMPEASEYFITRQMLNGRKLCEEFGFEYMPVGDPEEAKGLLRDFFAPGNSAKVLEIETNTTMNRQIFERLKAKIKKSYEL